MEILHVGYDGLQVAFQASLSAKARGIMARAKARAEKEKEPVYENIMGIEGHVFPNGSKGGYRYIFDQGPMAAKWQIKESDNPTQWNLFARVPARALAEYGLEFCIDAMISDLKTWDAVIMDNSVNRFDVCADIEAPGFEIDPAKVLCHSHSTVSRHGENSHENGVSIIGGARIDTVTIGKMPGRQIQIYDKRKEVVRKQSSFWFNIWGRTKDDPTVWRVEVRAGKKHLDDWGVKRLADLLDKAGDIAAAAFRDVRYLERRDHVNASRSTVHSFWQFARAAICDFLAGNMSGAEKGNVKEVIRADQKKMISRQIIGLSANLTALLVPNGAPRDPYLKNPAAIFDRLSGYISRLIRNEGLENLDGFYDKIRRVDQRYHYLNEGNAA